ncbi:hypothetical protein BVX99_00585 [bacterium F16]|nr:hypothetical protein BVX99_00585 [bacterium F16]
MELTHKEIPREFLENLPRGIRYARRNGRDHLIVEQAFCPNGHSLMVDNVRLHGEPSIKLRMQFDDASGFIFVDSFWGSHDKLYSFIPTARDLGLAGGDVQCAVCNCSLLVDHPACEACGNDRFIQMLLPGSSSKILVCAKLGCPEHELIANDLSPELSEIVSDINYHGL